MEKSEPLVVEKPSKKKYFKNKQQSKQQNRRDELAKRQDSQKVNKKSKPPGSISDVYHKVSYTKQLSELNTELSLQTENNIMSILSNVYNQSLDKYLMKNKGALTVSKNYKNYYCKKCFTNKKYNTKQELLTVHDMKSAGSDANIKSLLLKKTCKICEKNINIYVGQNPDYISFEESNIEIQ
ncbi:hypothetical protein FOG51_01688 [Hanseniaspora uvarum]|nr:hypothetical protein FOG48_03749 [Hanseniaspora uvarum]KAF0273442.1 hypothetical protein FOG51_01688 [Hanseniaspora uvarum]